VADFDRMPGESEKAYRAFTAYLYLPTGQRSLRTVSQALALERRPSGLRIIADGESTARAPEGHRKQPQKSGRVGLWSRQFRWRERAAAFDLLVDRRIQERQIEVIETMAARHAGQAELGLEDLMAPIIAFARAMEDPIRAAAFENLPMLELFKLCLTSASLLPKLQEAERIARGCKVVTNAQASPQSPSEWAVRIYQPPRPEPIPQFESGAILESDGWEEAEITPAK
jgi:hypothetical protein